MINMRNSLIMKMTTMMRMKHMMQRRITGTHIIEKNDVVMISRKESRRSLPRIPICNGNMIGKWQRR